MTNIYNDQKHAYISSHSRWVINQIEPSIIEYLCRNLIINYLLIETKRVEFIWK